MIEAGLTEGDEDGGVAPRVDVVPHHLLSGFGFRLPGFEFRVWGFGFKVEG